MLFFSGVLVKCGEEGWSLSKLNWRSVSAMGGWPCRGASTDHREPNRLAVATANKSISVV